MGITVGLLYKGVIDIDWAGSAVGVAINATPVTARVGSATGFVKNMVTARERMASLPAEAAAQAGVDLILMGVEFK